jgi:hypothetical protein
MVVDPRPARSPKLRQERHVRHSRFMGTENEFGPVRGFELGRQGVEREFAQGPQDSLSGNGQTHLIVCGESV